MKIAKFTLLLLLLVTNNSFAQFYKTYNIKNTDPVNLEREKKIRSKNNISESFEFIHQVNSNDSILKSHKTYTKNGEILTNTVFSLEQDTINYVTYEYIGEKLAKSKIFNKNKNILVLEDNRIFTYDKNGNNTQIQFSNRDGNTVYQKIDYNNKNLKKSLKTKWLENTYFSITAEYFYSKNNLIRENTYNQDGKLSYKTEYQYDTLGNLIGSYHLQNEKKVIINIYAYDKNGNIIEEDFRIINGPKSNSYKTKFEYDSKGNVVKQDHFTDDILQSTHVIVYKKIE